MFGWLVTFSSVDRSSLSLFSFFSVYLTGRKLCKVRKRERERKGRNLLNTIYKLSSQTMFCCSLYRGNSLLSAVHVVMGFKTALDRWKADYRSV